MVRVVASGVLVEQANKIVVEVVAIESFFPVNETLHQLEGTSN